jgi:membrane-associated phospholipid phosphatase
VATTPRKAIKRMAARLWWAPLVAIGFLTDSGSRRRWLLAPGVVILTALTSSAGKLVVRRPRPGSPYPVAPWGRLGAAGFPSTHSACAFALAGWMRASRQNRRLHALATLVAYSRIRCRAHHLTDVVAGATLGYAVSWQIDKIWGSRRSPISAPAQPLPIARTGQGANSHSPPGAVIREPRVLSRV